MNFCPDCESFLYLFVNKNNDNKLSEKCKNCGYIGEKKDGKLKVYSNTLDSDNLDTTFDIENNKYIIKDPTLPRLDNIDCINPKCITNDNLRSLIIVNFDNFNIELFNTYIKNKYKEQYETDKDITMEMVEIDSISSFDYCV